MKLCWIAPGVDSGKLYGMLGIFRRGRLSKNSKTETRGTLKDPEVEFIKGFGSSTGGVYVNSDTVLGLSAVFACVRIIAESVATLPLKLYRKSGEKREEMTDHPLNWLLKNEPNDTQTSFEFREMLQGHLGLRGNAYARIYKDIYGMPIHLEPWHPSFVRVVKSETGRLIYSYKGDPFDAFDVLHLKGLSSNGLVGLSPISILKDTFGLALAGQQHGLRTFENDATPSGVITTPNGKTPEQVEKMRSEWDKHHRGVSNTGRPAILYGGMEWKEVGLTNKDAQFLESRKFDVEEIARVYRVPLHLLQSTEKSTSWGTGIEQQNIGFVSFTLNPWLTRWEQSLNRVLLTERMKIEGYYFKFNVDSLLRGDFKARTEGYGKAIESGWMSRNEVRGKEDMNPIEGGDVYYRPLNTVPADQLGKEASV